MTLIDLTGENPVDLSQGFGSFDFAAPDSDCFDYAAPNRPEHLQRGYPSGIAKVEDGDTWEGWAASNPTLPLNDLPSDVRHHVYQCLIDELRKRPEDDAIDTGFPTANSGIRFSIVDRSFDSDLVDTNDGYTAVVAQAPSERNVDHRAAGDGVAQRMDVLDIYKAIQRGDLAADDPGVPMTWRQCRAVDVDGDDAMDDEESEAESSDAGSDSSGWDSDEAEVIVNLRRGQQQPGGWQPDSLLAARMEVDDVSMADSAAAAAPHLCVMVDPRAALGPDCLAHNPAAIAAQKTKRKGDSWRRLACRCTFRDPSVYDDIRHLALSHPRVAAELGELLWRDAVVELEVPATFLRFARERPAALPRVRGLVLTLDCAGTDVADTRTEDLRELVEFVSAKLDLRVVVVKLHTDATAGEESAVARKLREWGALFSGLKTEGFALEVSNLHYGGPTMKAEEVERARDDMRVRLLAAWTPRGIQGGMEGVMSLRNLSLRLRGA